jgi:hypothetical protein
MRGIAKKGCLDIGLNEGELQQIIKKAVTATTRTLRRPASRNSQKAPSEERAPC